ncbi:hypothetical protein B0O80DRAFT_494537 [Mortierella sp. GBAus27b]|nr:hypothetical protein B0O80DRAFT_494537 [Mortierella sp. GBAus27b]
MSEVDLKTRKEEGRLKATLVKCRRLTRIITDSLYSDFDDDTDTLRMGNLRHLTSGFTEMAATLRYIWLLGYTGDAVYPQTSQVRERPGCDVSQCTLPQEIHVPGRVDLDIIFEQPLDAECLQFVAGSHLRSLSVDRLSLLDETLASLMEHLPSTLTSLRLNTNSRSVSMGPRFVAVATALTFPSLSLLSWLPHVSTLTSTLVQQLLSPCDKIVHLDDTLSVDAVDLLTAPWVMSRLVKLGLTINDVASLRTVPSTHSDSDSSQNDGFDRTIYEQLSRLVSLEELVLIEMPRTDTSGVEETSWISFLLSHGMGELETLVRLRRMDIGGLKD